MALLPEELMGGFNSAGIPGLGDALPLSTQPQAGVSAREDVRGEKIRIVEEVDPEDLPDDPFDVELDDQAKQELLNDLSTQMKKMMAERDELNQKVDGWYKIYKQDVQPFDPPWEGASDVHVPYPSAIVDAAISRVNKATGVVKPPVLISAEDQSEQEVADKIQYFVEHIWENQIHFSDTLDTTYQNTSVASTGFVKNVWADETETVMEPVEYTTTDQFLEDFPNAAKIYPKYFARLKEGQPVNVYVEFEKVTKSGVSAEFVSFKNVYASDQRDFDKSKLIFEKMSKTYDEINRMGERGLYEKVSEFFSLATQTISESEIKYQNYDVYELKVWLDLKNDKKLRLYHIWLSLEPLHLFRVRRFPYKHSESCYTPFRMMKRIDSWQGVSFIEVVDSLSRATDKLMQQMVDSNSMALANMFKAKLGGSFNPRVHKVRPGKTWYLRNMDDVEELRLSGPNVQSNMIFAEFFRFMEQRTGISLLNLGLESPIDPSAPGNKTIALLQESFVRITDVINRVRPSVERCVRHWLSLYEQYMPEDGMDFTYGDEVIHITRKDLSIRYRIKVQTQSPEYNVDTEAAKQLQVYQVLAQDEMIQDFKPEAKLVPLERWVKLMGYEETEDLIPTKPEIQQKLAERLRAANDKAQIEMKSRAGMAAESAAAAIQSGAVDDINAGVPMEQAT